VVHPHNQNVLQALGPFVVSSRDVWELLRTSATTAPD